MKIKWNGWEKVFYILLAVGTVLGTSPGAWGQSQEQAMFLVPGVLQEGKEHIMTLTCPRDGKSFQIEVAENNPAFQKGVLKVTCPYDGYVFYPTEKVQKGVEEEKAKRYTVRCPMDGREFQAELNIQEIIRGTTGQLLKCPYDGTEFRVSLQSLTTADLMHDPDALRFQDALGRNFGAYLGQDRTLPKFSPFDGSKVTLPGLSKGKDGKKTPIDFLEGEKPERSVIEEMFAEETVPVSRSLKQFGYDLFPDPEEVEARSAQLMAGPGGMMPQGAGFQNPMGGGSGTQGFFSQLVGGYGLGSSQVGQNLTSGVSVGPDYVLGPDDTLVINMWGGLEGTFPVTVDRDGKIFLPKVGPVYVWGLKFEEAEKLVQQSLSQHFSNLRLSITMGRLRTIRVFVLGEVKRPGAYLVNAQATLFHALYAAYGPTKTGSFRKIKLLRDDKTEEIIDLYALFIRGDKSADHILKANDTIVVPPIGPVAGVAGGVKRPAIYELAGPASLDEVMTMAGGEVATGYLQRIQVERIFEHERKVVQDLEFKTPSDIQKLGSQVQVQDGDLILVFTVNPLRRNFVTVSGNVDRPGDYELKENMSLMDLIEKAGGFLPGTYFPRAEVLRFTTDRQREIIPLDLGEAIKGGGMQNIVLKEWDIVRIYSRGEVMPFGFVEVVGAVEKPGRYDLKEQMKVSDLLFRAGGLKPTALPQQTEFVHIGEDGQMGISTVNLQEILSDKAKDFYLTRGDILTVREAKEVLEEKWAAVSGEVRYPGRYRIRRDETLASLLKRAGGFSENAFLDGIVFTRESLRESRLTELKKFIEGEQNNRLQEQMSLGTGFAQGSQQGALPKLIEYQQNLLKEAEENEFLGRLFVRVESMEALEKKGDFPLEDGDTVFVPLVPSTIQIVGNVYRPGLQLFKDGIPLEYYLRKAGGLTQHADSTKLYVVRADGEVTNRFTRLKGVQRGDTIVVPEKISYKTAKGTLIKDTISVLYQVGLGAVLVSSLD